jgi:hypothetical protein
MRLPAASAARRKVPRAKTPGTLLCVPKTSSPSCDQAVFVDQATDTSLPSNAVPAEIDRFG